MRIQRYSHEESLLAILVTPGEEPISVDGTDFITEDASQFQIGIITRVAGSQISPHVHHPIERRVIGTPEALLVAQGSVRIDLYSEAKIFLESFKASAGDVIVFLGRGGHGFEFDEDCRLVEIKQGPFVEGIDKEKFHRDGDS